MHARRLVTDKKNMQVAYTSQKQKMKPCARGAAPVISAMGAGKKSPAVFISIVNEKEKE